MRAVIIAGGFGTRMRPLSLSRPKHLLPIVNRPLLEYQVAILKQAGISEIVFGTNHLAEQIVSHFGDGSGFGISLKYRVEPEPLGTAGAIRFAVEGLEPDRCIVFNGDSLHDFDIGKLIEEHERLNAEATITLYRVERPHPFGVVNRKDEWVTEFLEPSEEQKRAAEQQIPTEGTDLINAGLYILEPEMIEKIPKIKCSIEREFYPQMLAAGSKIAGIEAAGEWMDIGRPSQLFEAARIILSGEMKLNVLIPGEKVDGIYREKTAWTGVKSEVSGWSHLGANSKVGENVHILNSTIGSNSSVGENSILNECIVFENVSVGSSCKLSRCIIDRNSHIDDFVTASGAILGSNSRIPSYSRIGTEKQS